MSISETSNLTASVPFITRLRELTDERIVNQLCLEYGGTVIYLPFRIQLPEETSEAIRQQFNGQNHAELARRFKTSLIAIYKAVNQHPAGRNDPAMTAAGDSQHTSHIVMTPDDVRELFRRKGITFTQWAKEHGYSRNEVYRVLNGQAKANYGKAHEIAVKLGLKTTPDPA